MDEQNQYISVVDVKKKIQEMDQEMRSLYPDVKRYYDIKNQKQSLDTLLQQLLS
jgi:hypothetical protein